MVDRWENNPKTIGGLLQPRMGAPLSGKGRHHLNCGAKLVTLPLNEAGADRFSKPYSEYFCTAMGDNAKLFYSHIEIDKIVRHIQKGVPI